MVRAIFWDNDGVLVDTEELYFEATRDALAELGVGLSLDEYKELSLRQGRSCFDLARERGRSEAEIIRQRDERDARHLVRLHAGVALMEGVLDTLSQLHGRLPMAIVTSCKRSGLHAIHAPHDTLRFFEFSLASGEYARSKPHPEPYLEAAQRIGLEPAECLVVEDSERGLQAASRAGMTCLVVPNALTQHGDFSAAHRVLASVREVPQELARLLA